MVESKEKWVQVNVRVVEVVYYSSVVIIPVYVILFACARISRDIDKREKERDAIAER